MKTVQVAIGDPEYSRTISNLLRREGTHSVVVVDQPDPAVDGVIVLDCEHLERCALDAVPADRLILITRKDPDKLARIWNAGIRHVVFEEDSPNTVQLAVSAAELRQPRPVPNRAPRETEGGISPRLALHRHSQLRPRAELTVLAENVSEQYRVCHHRFRFSFHEEDVH